MQEHPRRRDLIDELHARPFAEVSAPCDVVFLACKHPENAVGRDRAAERDRLTDRLSAAGLDAGVSGLRRRRPLRFGVPLTYRRFLLPECSS